MNNICVIGDSHIAPLFSIANLEEVTRKHAITFFASHLNLMPGLVLDGKRLVAVTPELAEKFRQSSRGKDAIDLDRYDQIVMIGVGFSMRPTAAVYYHCMSDLMSPPTRGRSMVSDALFVEIALQRYVHCEALRLVKLIRSVSAIPVTLISAPNPGEGLTAERMMKGMAPYHEIVDKGDDSVLAEHFREVCSRVAAMHRIKVVAPLPTVAANGVFNKREFSSLPEALDPATDYNNEMLHAGGDYFRHLLPHVFPLVTGSRHDEIVSGRPGCASAG